MAASPAWKERDNCVRCCSLTLDGGGYFSKQLLLQETISNIKFSSIDALLTANQKKLNKLKSKHIVNETQYLLMFPLNGNSPQLDNWDITLTTLVLTNCVTLSQNQKDAIRDIRDMRNTVHGHTTQMAMTELEFQQTWTDITIKLKHCSTLLTDHNCQTRLNDMIASIQREVLSSDKVVETFKEWYESEKEIEKLIGGLVNKIDTHAETQKRKCDQLQQGIKAVKVEIGAFEKRQKSADPVLRNMQSRFKYTRANKVPERIRPPPEIRDIMLKLQNHHRVVVTGFDPDRQLEHTMRAIKGIGRNIKRCVEVHDANEWIHVCRDDVDLVLFVDPFGKDTYDHTRASATAEHFDRILADTQTSNIDDIIDIVFVTKHTIFQECLTDHNHVVLDQVVKIETPTTSLKPVNLTKKQKQQGETVDPFFCNLQGQSAVYLKHMNHAFHIPLLFRQAKDIFKQRKTILIGGPRKSGKTTLAVNLMSAYQREHCLVLSHPSQWQFARLGEVSVLLIEDFAGKYKLDITKATEWYTTFDMIYAAVMEGELNVIITCVEANLAKCIEELSEHTLLDHKISLAGREIPPQVFKTEQSSSSSTMAAGTPGAGEHTNTQLQARPYTATHVGDFSTRDFSARTKGGLNLGFIRGSCMLQDGSLFLLDYTYGELIRLDSSYRVTDVFDVDDYPRNVCCISATEIAVSTGILNTRIQFVSVSGKLTRTRSIQLEHSCNGLAYSSGELYVYDGMRRIDVYSTDGKRLRAIDVSKYWNHYYYGNIAVSDDGSHIFLCMFNRLVCLDKQRKLVWSFTDDYRWKVCVGNDNNVFACSRTTVYQLSPTGKEIGVIMQGGQDISSICYDRIRSRLIVTVSESNHIKVFELTR